MRRIAIVGASHAGVQVAVNLRREGYDGKIALVGSELELPYHRPPLSKDYLFTDANSPKWLRPPAFYTENRIDLELGCTVSRLDASGSIQIGKNGRKRSFDAIVLAVGAEARRLACPGNHLNGIHVLRDSSDADALRDSLGDDGPVAIVGAGFIGMELAAGLSARGRQVTIVERGKSMLARVLPPEAAEIMEAIHLSWGSRLKFNCGIRAFLGTSRVEAVELDDGANLPATTVVVAVGSEARGELARSGGLAWNNGVLVDPAMRASSPSILAVGDCASAYRRELGCTARLESVQSANEQARAAALSLLGKPLEAREVPWFWSDQRDAKLQIAGVPRPGTKNVVLPSGDPNRFTVLGLLGDRINHVVTLNAPADHVAARRAIAEKRTLTIAEEINEAGSFHAWCRDRRAAAVVAAE